MRKFLVVLLIFLFAIGIYWLWFTKHDLEGFDGIETLENQIIRVYMEVLTRQPTGAEMIDLVRKISRKEMSIDGLRQKLIDSEEYERLIKTQTNVLAPELNKMLSDKIIIEKIAKIYREEKKKQIADVLIYPYKDVYVELDYNEYAFRAFLRNKKYADFENDISRKEATTKEETIELFNKTFVKAELVKEGIAIQEKMEGRNVIATKSPTDSVSKSTETTTSMPASSSSLELIKQQLGRRTIFDTDSDSTDMLCAIQTRANEIFDKDLAARCIDKDTMRINMTHHNDMVLRPEYEWSVPQKRTPVCTTFGQKPLVQPVMLNSSLMLGTPLDDAKDTQVGSIMPKFEYQNYITVPKEKVKCGDDN